MKERVAEFQNPNDAEETGLIDLFAVVWRWKIMIIVITALAAIGVTIYAIVSIKLPTGESPMPNVFTADAYILTSGSGGTGGGAGGGFGAGLSNAINSISSAATGVNASAELISFLLGSKSMADAMVKHFNLIEKYGLTEPGLRTKSRALVQGSVIAVPDPRSDVVKISATSTDPVWARDLVNFALTYLQERFDEMGLDQKKNERENIEKSLANSYDEIKKLELDIFKHASSLSVWNAGDPSVAWETNRLQFELDTQKELYTTFKEELEKLKISIESEVPVFQILEWAEVPEQKSGPARSKMCIIVTAAAFVLSVILAFAFNVIDKTRKDPVSMAKLRGEL